MISFTGKFDLDFLEQAIAAGASEPGAGASRGTTRATDAQQESRRLATETRARLRRAKFYSQLEQFPLPTYQDAEPGAPGGAPEPASSQEITGRRPVTVCPDRLLRAPTKRRRVEEQDNDAAAAPLRLQRTGMGVHFAQDAVELADLQRYQQQQARTLGCREADLTHQLVPIRETN